MEKEYKYNITKCICYDTTFSEMKKIMQKHDLKTLDELKKVRMVASNCRLCLPYINRMIETGQTEFELILE
ncbi:MAG: (2Fe-2S)-binding protein [bacterium]|nr:(2Fe-2S)-binding protein [bacterium]